MREGNCSRMPRYCIMTDRLLPSSHYLYFIIPSKIAVGAVPAPTYTMLAADLLREPGGSVVTRPCVPVIVPPTASHHLC